MTNILKFKDGSVSEVKVGDTVMLVEYTRPKVCTVTKIGRKYVTLDWRDIQFSFEGVANSNYSSHYLLFKSLESYNDYKLLIGKRKAFYKAFYNNLNTARLDSETIDKVVEFLKLKEDFQAFLKKEIE